MGGWGFGPPCPPPLMKVDTCISLLLRKAIISSHYHREPTQTVRPFVCLDEEDMYAQAAGTLFLGLASWYTAGRCSSRHRCITPSPSIPENSGRKILGRFPEN